MNPVLSAFLLSWDLRVEVIATLLLAASLFVRGWWRIRRQRIDRHPLASGWRLTAYLGGLVILGVALMSPIDVFGGQFFFMHMVQHLLLVMIAPPLLLVANPLPFILWGLPSQPRRVMGRCLKRGSVVRRVLHVLTAPGLVWLVFVAFLLGWHDPIAYDAALRSDLIHDLEHMTFFGTSILFWWLVVGAGPRFRSLSPGVRLAVLLGTVPVNAAAGVAIAFASQPLYVYYTAVPRFWGITVMQDQMIGGVIMWIPGSMMYLLAALIIISRLIRPEADQKSLPESEWAAEEAIIAPGWKA